MIEQFHNLKSWAPDNQELALKVNEVICALNSVELAQQHLTGNNTAEALPKVEITPCGDANCSFVKVYHKCKGVSCPQFKSA